MKKKTPEVYTPENCPAGEGSWDQERMLATVVALAEARETLAHIQTLPELTWAQVTASLMMRFSRLAREGDPKEAQALMAVLDKGKTYVARLKSERDRALKGK